MARTLGRISGALVALAALAVAVPAMAGQVVQFHGVDSGSFSMTYTRNRSYIITTDTSAGSDPALGGYSVAAKDVVTFDNPPTAIIGSATLTFGDGRLYVLYGSSPIMPTDKGLESIAKGMIVGGTGRYQGASGSLDFDSVGAPTSRFGGPFSEHIDGMITLAGR